MHGGDGGVDNGGEEWEGDEGGDTVRHGGGKTRVQVGGEM